MHSVLAQLWQQVQAQRLAHAVLITGTLQAAERTAINDFAKALLCSAPSAQGVSCQQCRGCHLVMADNHPDLQWLVGTGKSNTINIDSIRALTDFCEQTPQCADKKVLVLHDAHFLNRAASNALLKTLEEPANNTYFILTSDTPAALPATIRSRCQQIAWLSEQHESVDGNDLSMALSQACHALIQGQADPLLLAEKWHKEPASEVVAGLQAFANNVIRESATAGYDCTAAFKFLDHINQLRQHLAAQINVNMQLQLESLFIACQPIKQESSC